MEGSLFGCHGAVVVADERFVSVQFQLGVALTNGIDQPIAHGTLRLKNRVSQLKIIEKFLRSGGRIGFRDF